MKSIFSKIFFGFLIIIIIFSAIIIINTNSYVKDFFIKTQINDLHKINSTIIFLIKDDLIKGDLNPVREKLKTLSKIDSIRITIINYDGKVLFDSEKDPATMENHLKRPEIIAAQQYGIGDSIRFSYTLNNDLLYTASVIKSDTTIIGFSRVSISINKIQTLIDDITSKIIYISLIGLTIVVLAIYLFSRSLIKPIKKLVEISNKIADGDFNSKIYLNNKDELSNLALSINQMSDKLKTLFEENFKQSEKLDSIFKAIKDGIIVINSKDYIIFSNENFFNTINTRTIINRRFWEFIIDPEFSKFIKKIRKNKSYLTTEIQINKRYFLVSGSWIESDQAIVVIFSDIDNLKKIETIKKDFISNISHELKTPLTSIKGFIETMEDEIDENNKSYLLIIKRQTERLISIVQDLLLLSRLEDINFKLEKSNVNIEDTVNNILKIFSLKMKEKNLTFKYQNNSDIKEINADPFMFEQLLINLFDNSIKFSEKGEFGLNISRENSSVIMEFWDTGIGIPDNQIDRIFERFFTVDKSRSKNISGTGLGLSIVKHIVLSHNGTITCKSNIGSGTKFIITLPLH